VFAANGGGILLARQLAAARLPVAGPTAVMRFALTLQATAATGVLIVTVAGLGLAPLLLCLFVAAGSIGAVLPMATALAMNDHPQRAGTASGLLGFTQFALGSAVAPVVGAAGPGSAIPMAVTMPACALAAIVALSLADARAAPVPVKHYFDALAVICTVTSAAL
jgi:MFS transporter, DHA1 family, multidrug resistance protein